MPYPAYLAFETGGSKLVAAVADAEGKLLESCVLARPPDNHAPQSLSALIEVAQRLRMAHEARGAVFKGIGFGYGGQVSRSAQRVLPCPHEAGWDELDVRDVLSRSFDLPSILENDCKLAALAEATRGAGHGYPTAMYVTIGTGIGAGIVRNGRIVDFGDAGEAEIGHIVVASDIGWACGCGSRGCLETVAAGPGIAALAKQMAADCSVAEWREAPLARRAQADKHLTARDVFDAYHRDDAFAAAVLHRVIGYLRLVLSSAIQIVNPDVIIFGGGVGASSARFVALLEAETRPLVMPSLRGRCAFARSHLREHVVTQGAALLAAQVFPG